MKKLITTTLILGAMIASSVPTFADVTVNSVDTTSIDGSVIGTLVTDSQKEIKVKSGGDIEVNLGDFDTIRGSVLGLWLDTNGTDVDVSGNDLSINSCRDFAADGSYVDTLVREGQESINAWSRR